VDKTTRKLGDVFIMVWPRLPLTLRNMERFSTLVFQFELINDDRTKHGAVFKGIPPLTDSITQCDRAGEFYWDYKSLVTF
jgi:hypothetical protein